MSGAGSPAASTVAPDGNSSRSGATSNCRCRRKARPGRHLQSGFDLTHAFARVTKRMLFDTDCRIVDSYTDTGIHHRTVRATTSVATSALRRVSRPAITIAASGRMMPELLNNCRFPAPTRTTPNNSAPTASPPRAISRRFQSRGSLAAGLTRQRGHQPPHEVFDVFEDLTEHHRREHHDQRNEIASCDRQRWQERIRVVIELGRTG